MHARAVGRALRCALAAVVAAATMVSMGELFAATSLRKEHKHERYPLARPAYGLPRPDPSVERDASKMRFGSLQWWDEMRREGRLGGETP